MKLLVTGSNGMIGHNILENNNILQYDLLCPSSSELNLLNYKDIDNYIKNYKPEMVIHCAGRVGGIQVNMQNMYTFFVENALMGINLVQASKKNNIKKFLNLSSSCVYPREHINPLKEEYILKGELEPTNEGYALAKLSVQKMCEYISKEHKEFKYKTFIPCNLYGRWDKFDEQNSHMIPSVIKKIHNAKRSGLETIEIWGDGTARREFMYASDIASVVIKAINDFDTIPNTLNIGLGVDYSVNEYYEIIKNVIGYKGNFFHDLSKPSGMKQKLLDISKQTEWGWEPLTSLREGITKTYQFFLENNNNEI